MIYHIFSDKDATIYNRFPYKNTGLDSINELSKTPVSGSDSYVSRFLVKFNLDDLREKVEAGKITNPKYYLRLYTSDVSEIPLSYEIKVYAVSQSWEMGIGKEDNIPMTTVGVNWYTRDGYNSWETSSAAPGSQFYDILIPGGGTWYTTPTASQQFEYESSDLKTDVTDIVNLWLSDTIPNDGFIVKWSNEDESNSNELGTINFFSTDSHTIYQPKLEVSWDDSAFITGSLTEINEDDTTVVYLKQFKEFYNINEKTKIRVIGRDAFPRRTYSTSSVYTTVTKFLPSSSYYAIYDAHSEESIIPFDENYTKLSCDSNGNYFRFWMDSLSPERYYRIKIKSNISGDEKYFDNKFYFKVIR